MRLKHVAAPARPHVVHNIELQILHSTCGRTGKTHARFFSRQSVASDLFRERYIAESVGNDMKLVIAASNREHKLPAPFFHPAPGRVEFIDDNSDSHNSNS